MRIQFDTLGVLRHVFVDGRRIGTASIPFMAPHPENSSKLISTVDIEMDTPVTGNLLLDTMKEIDDEVINRGISPVSSSPQKRSLRVPSNESAPSTSLPNQTDV
jgi:hypothetical protein